MDYLILHTIASFWLILFKNSVNQNQVFICKSVNNFVDITNNGNRKGRQPLNYRNQEEVMLPCMIWPSLLT